MGKRTGRIHAAKTVTDRLDKALRVLRRRGETGATTMEIIQAAKVCAVNSIVSELRELGYVIECERQAKDRWRYWLLSEPTPIADIQPPEPPIDLATAKLKQATLF